MSISDAKLILPTTEEESTKDDGFPNMPDEFVSLYEKKKFVCYFEGQKFVNFAQACERLRDWAMNNFNKDKQPSKATTISMIRLNNLLTRQCENISISERKDLLLECLHMLQTITRYSQTSFSVEYAADKDVEADATPVEQPLSPGTFDVQMQMPQQQQQQQSLIRRG